MEKRFVAVNTPVFRGNERKYLCECIDGGWISSEGPFVSRMEEGLAAYCGCKYGVAVTNGTAALDAAVRALGLPPGSEVILPSFTIISCASAIHYAGCVPVPVDCDPKTWNMDLDAVRKAITPKTSAIMAVHIYGLPCYMPGVMEIAREFKLKVVEDTAEAIGLECAGRQCGSWGDVSTFSFYPNKHITTGEGGMILTNSEEIAERCRSYRNLCFKKERRFVHDELGWNLRMSNIQAAIGVAQLEQLPWTVNRKREIGRRYNERLRGVKGVQLPLERTSYAENIYWMYSLVLDDALPVDATAMAKLLADRGVATRPFFWPIHEQPYFVKRGFFQGVSCPVSSRIARRGFYLPSGTALKDDEIDYCADALLKTLEAL